MIPAALATKGCFPFALTAVNVRLLAATFRRLCARMALMLSTVEGFVWEDRRGSCEFMVGEKVLKMLMDDWLKVGAFATPALLGG